MKQSHKTLLLWVLLIVMFLAIWQVLQPGERKQQVSFSEFVTWVHSGQVPDVHVKDREYQFTHVVDGKNTQVETLGPVADQALIQDLENNPLSKDGKFKIYTFSTTHLVVDITGYYSASPTDANGAGLLFNSLPTPMRLLETRPDFPGFPLTGCYRTNAPIAGQPNIRTQPVWGMCSDQLITIPNTARAIVGNATVINPVAAGFLTFYPGDVMTAPTVATSNYPFPVTFGYNRHYYVGLSPVDGTFKILTQFTTDSIVDVSGYFAP